MERHLILYPCKGVVNANPQGERRLFSLSFSLSWLDGEYDILTRIPAFPSEGTSMNASDLFKAGKLTDAIDAQVKEVKATPADHGKRLFLFELLAFAGDLDRARRQIDAINYGEMERDTAVLAYRKLLDSEQARRRLFAEGLKPQFLIDPPDHVQLRLDAVNRLREHRPAEAAESLARANDAVPAFTGQLNGKPFAILRDCDDLFAGVLEVMSQGNYFWLPLEQVDTLSLSPPKFPRDLLWRPGHLEVRDGPAGDVFLPSLYPGSQDHPDTAIKLGRSTDWKSEDGGPTLGLGARTFLIDDDALSLLEWRELVISGPASGSSGGGGP
jgi:type VI secretion system protein ImpE